MNNTRRHFGHKDSDYLTTVIGQLASEFLANNVLRNRPFLAVLAPPAPHAPYIPEAQYMQDYSNLSVPRTDAYNLYSPDKHWIVSS
jgi:N-acetylglucosamine-6-sulfatase